MPATRVGQTTDETLNQGSDYLNHNGLKHEKIRYTSVDNGDAVSPGQKSIVEAAWTPIDGSDIVVAVTLSASQVGFVSTGDGHDGYLHIWSRGY